MTPTAIIDAILIREGDKFTNDPNDSGGQTKWGVTQAVLSEEMGRPATIAEVANLSRTQAFDIYMRRFFIRPRFDKVASLSQRIAEELTDTGVNMGTAVATQFLQRALNALNLGGEKYSDLKVDGDCGQRTLDALKTFIAWRGKDGERVLLRALNALQGERYIDLAEKRPKDEAFLYGWLLNRVEIA